MNEIHQGDLYDIATADVLALREKLQYRDTGLTEQEVESSRKQYGRNQISVKNNNTIGKRLWSAIGNPFNLVLAALAVFSYFSDVVFADPEDRTWYTVIIITAMVTISATLKFIEESRSGEAAAKLSKMISRNATVIRDGKEEDIPVDDLVVGDVVLLRAGSMIPADLRIVECKDLMINQSALTGESEPVEKKAQCQDVEKKSLTELEDIAFLGSSVNNGSAKAIVAAVGNNTMLGGMAKQLSTGKTETTFEKGVASVSRLLVTFMAVMVPIVFVINIVTKGDWMGSLVFAISIAVGLTPEMLPMVVTTSLAKGAVSMSKKKVIVKDINSIQNFGSIDVLCTDKTGTLTQDKVIIQQYLDIHGHEDDNVLLAGYVNSNYQSGLRNLIDESVIDRYKNVLGGKDLPEFTKVSEIPFDFQRRRLSVAVTDQKNKTWLITKGAIEEVFDCCKSVMDQGVVKPLDSDMLQQIKVMTDRMNANGMRLLAVAKKEIAAEKAADLTVFDESEMTLLGFLALLDPPKETTERAIQSLREYNVAVKVLTGDNEKVAAFICGQVGLPVDHVLMGSDIAKMSQEELDKAVEETTLFAKLSPDQKALVVSTLRKNGHSVGFMGDGINDAPALKAADVGISVDTAVDIAKEEAKVVLLEKDLMILKEGVVEGRRVYANMIKYIKMTASSNFGNVFSVLIASIFLPFLPMASIQLLTLNLIYDISCIGIPWDNVDDEYIQVPRAWAATDIRQFMFWFGPTSSIFDVLTYIGMFFWICPMVMGGAFHTFDAHGKEVFESVFQSGWFIVSMWTQTLVVHMIRTKKIPFIQSQASFGMMAMTALGILVGTMLPFTPVGVSLQMCALPAPYFLLLLGVVAGYILLTTVVKKLYVRKYGELL